MDNLAKANVMEIMKLTIREDFHRGTVFFSFSYHKTTLFEKKYDIKLIILISMYHCELGQVHEKCMKI